MERKSELESFKKWQHVIYFTILLGSGVTAWNSVVAQSDDNTEDIIELQQEQKVLKDDLLKIGTTVTEIKTTQQHVKDDIQEIKSDLKLLIRSLGND